MHQTKFVAKDDQTYLISITDTGEEISVFLNDEKQGIIDLKHVRTPPGDTYFLITVLDLENANEKGSVKLRYGSTSRYSANPSRPMAISEGRKSNESALTREGILFIQKMRLKEVVEAEEFYNAFSEDE